MPKVQYFRNSTFDLLAIWGLVVGSGVFFLECYSTRPGDAADKVGRSAVIYQILGIKRSESGIPVFGCPLFGFDTPVGEESRR
jgi:hypothetical protein